MTIRGGNCMGYGDILDFFKGKEDEPLKGTYYSEKPFTPDADGVRFSYDIVDEPTASYANVLNTLNTELKTQTIKTNDACGFKVKGYCVTQDGGLWQIASVVERIISANNKQALRSQVKTIDTIYVIRLIGVNNPWGFK